MPRETLGYVKFEWTCPKCGSRNPGPEKSCLSCGAPQPENVAFVQAESEEASQDEKLKEIAEKGADIHCGFCGTRNPADALVCTQCGADLTSGVRREAGKVVGAYQARPVKQIACPNCGEQNPETALKCSQCGAPLKMVSEVKIAPETTARTIQKPNPLLFVGIGVLVLLCIIGAIALISAGSARETQLGVVQSAEWQTRVAVEELGPVQRQTWQDDIPQGAPIGDCQDRLYTVVDSQPSGGNYTKVCGTPYTLDTGSGVGQVVQDCQYEVYRPYCEYTVQEWRVVDELRMSGNDRAPRFASPQLSADQRMGNQISEYLIVFQTDESQYTYSVGSLEEFQQFTIGSKWSLNINAFGQIVSVEPPQ